MCTQQWLRWTDAVFRNDYICLVLAVLSSFGINVTFPNAATKTNSRKFPTTTGSLRTITPPMVGTIAFESLWSSYRKQQYLAWLSWHRPMLFKLHSSCNPHGVSYTNRGHFHNMDSGLAISNGCPLGCMVTSFWDSVGLSNRCELPLSHIYHAVTTSSLCTFSFLANEALSH